MSGSSSGLARNPMRTRPASAGLPTRMRPIATQRSRTPTTSASTVATRPSRSSTGSSHHSAWTSEPSTASSRQITATTISRARATSAWPTEPRMKALTGTASRPRTGLSCAFSMAAMTGSPRFIKHSRTMRRHAAPPQRWTPRNHRAGATSPRPVRAAMPSAVSLTEKPRRRPSMFRFDHWAQPVTHRGWAVVTVILDAIKRASGYRLFVHAAHVAWERAVR